MILYNKDPNHPREMMGSIHCPRCQHELPDGWHISQWEDLEVGVTAHGIQVWCRRHDQNVQLLDFPTARRFQPVRSGLTDPLRAVN